MAILTYPLKIKQIKQEARDSANFLFEVPCEHKDLFFYTPAQFLTFEFQVKGQSFLRSYSISSCPLLNEPLQTTVKRVKGGVISNYMIDHLKEGDIVLSRKPAGRFFKAPSDLKPKHYFLFAGGSGITPLFSVLKTVLLSDKENKVTLFYANRDEDSTIYLQELKHWLGRYPKRLNITWILSQPKKNQTASSTVSVGQAKSSLLDSQNMAYIKGRLQTNHLEQCFASVHVQNKNHLYYLCGPLGFMATVQNFLIANQVEKKQIRKESFFSTSQKEGAIVAQTQEKSQKDNPPAPSIKPKPEGDEEPELRLKGPEESEKAPPETIKACLNEEKITISAEEDIPILEQLLSAGHSPPFSCLSGSCMSCLAVLKKGQIIQEEQGILEEENIKNHEILTCQAKPVSRIVEVDYDIATN